MTAITDYMPRAQYSPVSSTVPEETPWPAAARFAFRFCVVYFVWYVLTTQMLGSFLIIPGLPVPDFGKIPPMKQLVIWVGNHVINTHPTLHPTGSGDTAFDWTQAFMMVVVSFVVAIAWSFRSSTTRHDKLLKWFSLFLRYALATSMLSYGFAKVFPLQMPTIFLSRLLEPYGNFSPMGVIWYSIGAAPGYERFIGSAEVLGGILLMLPQTALVGALVTFGVTFGVWMVNMTYDVPVKLFAFHLVVMSIVLFAPELPRLLNFFLFHRAVDAKPAPEYGDSPTTRRMWGGAQTVFVIWALIVHTYGGFKSWYTFGGGAPKSALYGVWDVDSMTVDGVVRPPLTTDTTLYTHAVFQNPAGATFQKMDQTFDRLAAKIDTASRTIALTNPAKNSWRGDLTYQRPAPNRLVFDGTMGGKKVQIAMTQRDLNKFFLVSRGFHWLQEFPVNR
jgi:hypothetical protein